jgi:hypothetical protein
MDHSCEDNFEALEEWIELRVQVMEEAREETNGIRKKTDNRAEQKKRFRGFILDSPGDVVLFQTVKRITPRGFATLSKIYPS